MALFFLISATTVATAPTKPREIDPQSFVPVVVAEPLIIVDPNLNKSTPAPRPRPKVQPSPIIKNLTLPPLVQHNRVSSTVGDAKAYALNRLGSTQYYCLDKIAIHESNWNPFDLNSSSGAYGIPQALPGSKMAWAGSDWRTNPVTQVKWMIHYMNGRYGSACSAWDFWIGNRWY